MNRGEEPAPRLDTESRKMTSELHDFLSQPFGVTIDLAWFPPPLICSEYF